jgi:putative oxidoreductase
MNIGILILRAIVGLTIAAHGAQKTFGSFGGSGIAGTAGLLESLGFRPGRLYAYLLGIAELTAGVLMALGLFTPAAALVIIGVMTAATVAVHLKNGFFVTSNGFEHPLVVAAAAAAIAFAGPGRYSLDALLDLQQSGVTVGLWATLAGVAVGLVVAALRYLPDKVRVRKVQTR